MQIEYYTSTYILSGEKLISIQQFERVNQLRRKIVIDSRFKKSSSICEPRVHRKISIIHLDIQLKLPKMKVAALTEGRRPYALRPIQKYSRYPLRSIRQSNIISMKRPIVILEDIAKKKNNNENVSKFKFLTLNDNCILYVMENLSLVDLCTMAEVSVRMQQLAQLHFRLRYRNLNMRTLMDGDQKITMKQTRSLLRNFGPLIQSLHVSRKDFTFDQPPKDAFKGQRRLLWLINKYCSLDSLTLGHFWLNMDTIISSVSFFRKLNTLNFYRVSCYCPEEKTFHHFGTVLSQVLSNTESTQRAPQIVQLV